MTLTAVEVKTDDLEELFEQIEIFCKSLSERGDLCAECGNKYNACLGTNPSPGQKIQCYAKLMDCVNKHC